LLNAARLLDSRLRAHHSPKLVQALLGHHSAAFTMDVYSDLWPTAPEGIGERIAVALFSGDGSRVVARSLSKEMTRYRARLK
jgi:integrase